MMAYKALCRFRDLEDGHLYDAGDEFPHDGRGIDPARIAELSGSLNKAGKALIFAASTAMEETHSSEEKPRQKGRRPRKTDK